MDNENSDLLDLCRLNEMEDHDVPEELQKAIDWKKRQVAEKLRFDAPVATEAEMARHVAANRIDGGTDG